MHPDTRTRRRHAVGSTLENVTAILATGPVDRERLDRIRAELQQLASQVDLFPAADFPPPSKASGATSSRYLVARDESSGTTLYLNSIIAGKDSKPHDHGTWAAIAAIEGEELNRLYRRTDDGLTPGVATLSMEGQFTVKPGASIAFLPTDIHSIHVQDGPPVRHLHLYGQPLESLNQRLGFDPESGTVHRYNERYMRKTVASDAG